jgi:hypothetical protein
MNSSRFPAAAFVVLCLLPALAPSSASAQDNRAFARFLVPFHVASLPGGYGSRWQSETWVHYSGTASTTIIPHLLCFSVCPLGGPLEPNWGSVPFRPAMTFPELALLVHVEQEHAGDVVFASRVRELSRSADSAGTEVPVIREADMSASTLRLLNVPIRPELRDMLRIYALPDLQDIQVDVRYFHQFQDGDELVVALLRQDRIRLRIPPPLGEYRLHPAVAEVGDLQAVRELAPEHAIWIEVAPVTPDARIWAFVSVTNNETQQVTLITPQR